VAQRYRIPGRGEVCLLPKRRHLLSFNGVGEATILLGERDATGGGHHWLLWGGEMVDCF